MSAREARRRERDGLIARRFRELAGRNPQCAPHRLMVAIAEELEMTPMGVRVSLLRSGSYVPVHRRTDDGKGRAGRGKEGGA